jgi:hypothetical protein
METIMPHSNEIQDLAKWLAGSKSISAQTKHGVAESLLAASETIPVRAQGVRPTLKSQHLAEALMLAAESGETLHKLRDALVPFAEAGQVHALVDAIGLGSHAHPDIGGVTKALTSIMESGHHASKA